MATKCENAWSEDRNVNMVGDCTRLRLDRNKNSVESILLSQYLKGDFKFPKPPKRGEGQSSRRSSIHKELKL